ncbi:SGNH/GDSL hydrolase family protein [Poseidonibacter ostreae]|uniref:SGNH hydrolase-type esterase domain-containing protein n=1 Tax=Poseidonibacter ostreae TaxID=2654171 RepID=A0A6L4WUA4_9BACT|nr:SGNH/GDSL hydrolase family protein [Poseidonibacter ostreae]KAB7889774.1 hypothetical protein GBG19_05175 [Poseidonibacter ostreae]
MKKVLIVLILISLNLIAGMKEIIVTDPVLTVRGLEYWEENKPDLFRLPKSKMSSIDSYLFRLGTMPSGGVIEFYSDATEISLKLRGNASENPNLTRIAKIGVDLYVDNKFMGNFVLNDKGVMKDKINLSSKKFKEFKLYLPLYEKISIDSILLNENAKIKKVNSNKSRVLFYGSSITQGSSASNPGLSYPAILSRDLDFEMLNFGFSGNGLAQKEIIDLIKHITVDIFVIDFWANPSVDLYKEKLPYMIQSIRSINKNVPIIVTSPIYNIGREKENDLKYYFSLSYVNKLNEGGGYEYILL